MSIWSCQKISICISGCSPGTQELPTASNKAFNTPPPIDLWAERWRWRGPWEDWHLTRCQTSTHCEQGRMNAEAGKTLLGLPSCWVASSPVRSWPERSTLSPPPSDFWFQLCFWHKMLLLLFSSVNTVELPPSSWTACYVEHQVLRSYIASVSWKLASNFEWQLNWVHLGRSPSYWLHWP